MNVTVVLMGNLPALLAPGSDPVPGQARLALVVPESTTVAGLLRLVGAANPEFAARAFAGNEFSGAFQVVVGDRHLSLAGGWNRVLAEGDTVTLIPPFAGG